MAYDRYPALKTISTLIKLLGYLVIVIGLLAGVVSIFSGIRGSGLVAFYTIAKGKLQAWEIPSGTPAAIAAGKIHTDMEKGFIRAKVASADELIEAGDLHEIQTRGHVRTVGRDHEICDGDVVEFFFSG